MTHTLIITNTTHPDKKFKAQIEAMGFDITHAPALSVSYCDADVSPSFSPKIIIVTSKHALHGIDGCAISKNIEVVCVGEILKELLISNGYTNIRNCFENGDDLISDIKEHSNYYSNVLYLRGKDVQHDIKSVCSDLNIMFEEYVVYESTPNSDFINSICCFIDVNQSVTICVFSKKGADSLADNIKLSGFEAITKRTNILCLSQSMISSLEQFQWRKSTCCTSPTRANFLKQLSTIKKGWV